MNGKMEIDSFSLGFLVGIIAGEGHFGGDGKQPQITLRMHVRHAKLFEWLVRVVPGSRLYGPYHHGGRHYLQWMVRGEALKTLLPHLRQSTLKYLDTYTFDRFQQMVQQYHLDI